MVAPAGSREHCCLGAAGAEKWASRPLFGCADSVTVGEAGTTGVTTARDDIVALLEPEVESLGYELADIEVNISGGGVLRLFIDRPDSTPENGVTLEDCEQVSRQVSAVLDVEDPIPGGYTLEVSSPGLNRRLVKPAHFERFAGNRVKLKLKRLVEGRRNVKGRLMGYEEPNVLVKDGKETFAIPLIEIDMARLVPDL